MLHKAITKQIKPFLIKNNFIRLKPRLFIRNRGELLDIILFEIGRHGKLVYLHYFINLLANPTPETTLSSYNLGKKVGKSIFDNISWESSNEIDTLKTILSIKEYIEKDVINWFNKIDTLEKYVVERYMIPRNQTEIFNFCDVTMCKILGKDKNNLFNNMYGMYSPCTDKNELYNLLNKTTNIRKDEIWIQNCKDENIKRNSLYKIFN